MKLLCALAAVLIAVLARAEDKPNALERGVNKAGKAIERTGDRGAKATSNGLNTAGKAVGRTVDKTENWVKKKTQ
jgi:hypothetical protein